MPSPKDDWQKQRSRGTRFTEKEIARIKLGFQHQEKLRDVARELGASSRNVSKYYGYFRAEGVIQYPKGQ